MSIDTSKGIAGLKGALRYVRAYRDQIFVVKLGGEVLADSRAVDDIAAGFEVTARCPDGIVEAIESKMPDWFAIGTQFHPEAATASALDRRIFDEFIDAVKESAAAMRMVA